MRPFLFAVSFLAVLLLAAPGRAQPIPPYPPKDDPMKGPRLEFARGPQECPDERSFRVFVTYWMDGIDHLAADSLDVVRVKMERVRGGYRGTVIYIDATGKAVEPVVRERDHCEVLAYHVARIVSEHIPDPPPCPAPQPCPECPAPPPCPAPRPCPACAAPRPVVRPKGFFMLDVIGLSGIVFLTGGLWADPGVAFGLAMDFRGTLPEEGWKPILSLGLEFRVALPGRVDANIPLETDEPSYPRSFDVSQYGGAFVPCARWKYFFGCAVVQASFLFVDDGDYLSESQYMVSLGPRLGVRLPLGDRFALFAFGEALFTPAAGAFDPQAPQGEPNPNVYWLVSPVQGYGAAGVEVTF